MAITESLKHPTDMGASLVAKAYAEALLGAAAQANQVDEVHAEFCALVRDAFQRERSLEAVLGSQVLSTNSKEDLIRKIFSGRASDLFTNFLLTVNRHGRLELLRTILWHYERLYEQRAKRVHVHITAAQPLNDGVRERIRSYIRSKLQMEPVLEEMVDPNLLGGMVIRIADWMYDGSVRTRLAKLQESLQESSQHEIQSRRDRFSSANGN
jgi:F-type H+-transporting ATPase subunit delta